MTTRKRLWLRLIGYVLLGALAAICILLIFGDNNVIEANFKKIQAGMTQREVEQILGGAPFGISKAQYWPLDATGSRKGRVWRVALTEVSVVFDDEGKVIAKWSSPAAPETRSEKVTSPDPRRITASQIFDVIVHLGFSQDIRDQIQPLNDLAQRSRVLSTIGDAGMCDSRSVKAQEIVVLCENDTLVGQAKSEVLIVRRLAQADLVRHRHVQPKTPQSVGKCV